MQEGTLEAKHAELAAAADAKHQEAVVGLKQELQGRVQALEKGLRDKETEVECLKAREAELGNELERSSDALQAAETRLAEAVETHRSHACLFPRVFVFILVALISPPICF